jgi:hypothetical protein
MAFHEIAKELVRLAVGAIMRLPQNSWHVGFQMRARKGAGAEKR